MGANETGGGVTTAVLVGEVEYLPAVTNLYSCDDGKYVLVTVLAGEVVSAGETLVFWADEQGRPCDEQEVPLTSLEPWQCFADGPDFGEALDRVGYTLT